MDKDFLLLFSVFFKLDLCLFNDISFFEDFKKKKNLADIPTKTAYADRFRQKKKKKKKKKTMK